MLFGLARCAKSSLFFIDPTWRPKESSMRRIRAGSSRSSGQYAFAKYQVLFLCLMLGRMSVAPHRFTQTAHFCDEKRRKNVCNWASADQAIIHIIIGTESKRLPRYSYSLSVSSSSRIASLIRSYRSRALPKYFSMAEANLLA